MALFDESLAIGTSLCKKWEDCKLIAYPDPASGGDPWTIGYGATGPTITEGVVWTQQQADADLASRLNVLYNAIYASINPNVALTPYQMGSFLCLAYNIGLHAFLGSTLLRCFNQGQEELAALHFMDWDYAAGKVNQGLVNRRADEKRIFEGGIS